MMSRCAPPKSASSKGVRRPGLPSRPRRESAAICRPAIQPSVRLSSAATTSAASLSPIVRSRKAAASSRVKRSSCRRISVTCDCTRRRASDSGGSSRVAMMTCRDGGRCSSRKTIPACSSGWVIAW